jgi:hypothetical protein
LPAVEVIKRRVAGLHQITAITSMTITDTWEPKDEQEGLSTLHVNRNISAITVTLSTTPLDSSQPGYQPPLPADQVKPLDDVS